MNMDTIDGRNGSNASNQSILRSSSLYTANNIRKRVSIVSPVKLDCIERRRDFINTTISYCDIKNILGSMGYDCPGSYQQCVDILSESNWVPNRKYILHNEKLRAKPIFNEDERIINLDCADIEYLEKFNLNQLKKWLKYNNISLQRNLNKYECIQLINKNYSYKSPSPVKRSKLPPKTPKRDENAEMSLDELELNGLRMQLSFDDSDNSGDSYY